MRLAIIALVVFIMNLPFGYWRANTKKFSWQWIASIHLPVPFVILLRIFGGLGWKFITFPVLISAFFAGQFAGSIIFKRLKIAEHPNLTSCLFLDIIRIIKSE